MNLTEKKRISILKKIYVNHLNTLSELEILENRLELGEKSSAASFLVERKLLSMKDFNLGLSDDEDIIDGLDRYWRGTPLSSLVSALRKIAPHFETIEEKSTVSSLIYEMF